MRFTVEISGWDADPLCSAVVIDRTRTANRTILIGNTASICADVSSGAVVIRITRRDNTIAIVANEPRVAIAIALTWGNLAD